MDARPALVLPAKPGPVSTLNAFLPLSPNSFALRLLPDNSLPPPYLPNVLSNVKCLEGFWDVGATQPPPTMPTPTPPMYFGFPELLSTNPPPPIPFDTLVFHCCLG